MDFSKHWLGIFPMAMEGYNLVPANAASTEHISQTLLEYIRSVEGTKTEVS